MTVRIPFAIVRPQKHSCQTSCSTGTLLFGVRTTLPRRPPSCKRTQRQTSSLSLMASLPGMGKGSSPRPKPCPASLEMRLQMIETLLRGTSIRSKIGRDWFKRTRSERSLRVTCRCVPSKCAMTPCRISQRKSRTQSWPSIWPTRTRLLRWPSKTVRSVTPGIWNWMKYAKIPKNFKVSRLHREWACRTRTVMVFALWKPSLEIQFREHIRPDKDCIRLAL